MSPYIMMLIVIKIGEVTEKIAITLDVGKIPEGLDINDVEGKKVADYLVSFLHDSLKPEGMNVESIEKIDHTIEPHYEFEKEHYFEREAESESEPEGISDIQRNDFEGRIGKLKDASYKTKAYANGCIRSKGVCKPERVIENLTI